MSKWRIAALDHNETVRVIRGTEMYELAADEAARRILGHAHLLAACEVALETLSAMTTDEFGRGGDGPVRILLELAIAKATNTVNREN